MDNLANELRTKQTPLGNLENNDTLNDPSDISDIDILKNQRLKNLDRVIIGHLNVNSLRKR